MEQIVNKAKVIAQEARNSLGNYCINTCGAKCCKSGFLALMNEKEVDIVVGKKKQEYLNKGLLIEKEGKSTLYNLEKGRCKNLTKKNLCGVHKDPNKPRLCDDFPLFLSRNYAIVASTCPGANEGLLDSYLDKLKKLGYKII